MAKITGDELMNRPEILSPAGSWETLRAAVAAGADAVYFGGRSFNARRNAANFDDQQLSDAIRYCHERGVKAYITLNTLVFDDEIQGALEFAELAAKAGADALIMQDLGLASLIKKAAPELKLDASTQLSVHNLEGVNKLARIGFSRVVLARELSKDEIREIAEQSPIELEVFVHGALCMSVSGQCYMSAMLGGRSGNRGLCAQPCRLPFSVPGGTGHDLSLKDLSLIARMDELKQMGIASLKIEGRMKRPEYVAAATELCVKAAEGRKVSSEEMNGLRAVFSRSGFTQGYFDARLGREMFGTREYEDVVSAQDVLKDYRKIYEGVERPRVGVKFAFTLQSGEKSRLEARDPEGNTAEAFGAVPEKALHKDVDEELIRDKLSKTGGTPFFAVKIESSISPGLSIPVSEINRMRRDCLERLLEVRGNPKEIAFGPVSVDSANSKKFSTFSTGIVENLSAPVTRVRLQNVGQLTPSVLKAGLVFLPVEEIIRNSEKVGQAVSQGARIGAELPRVIFGKSRSEEMIAAVRASEKIGIRELLCENLGAVELAQTLQMRFHLGTGLNIANSQGISVFGEGPDFPGAKSVLCSFETTLRRIRKMAENSPVEVGLIAYGHLPLMLVRNCPLKNGGGCGKCAGALNDRRGGRFPVACGYGASEVLNDRPVWMADRMQEIWQTGVGFIQLYFTKETPAEIDRVLTAYQQGAAPLGEFTRGLYYRGVE